MVLRRLAAAASFAVAAATLAALPAESSPADSYVGPHVGDKRVPAECLLDMSPANPDNDCYHMLVGLNALDSPKVDVAVLVPVSPTAERDLRIMRQAVHMWEGGIDYLSEEMDLDWLAEGVEFRVTGEEVEVGDDGLPVSPVQLTDPEIVVVATNPVGGIGIGIDPVDFIAEIGITDADGVPCSPADLSVLEDEDHGQDTGVYVEDCGGQGGNVCFAFNGAIDPVPGTTDLFGIFDLVTHEFGHCLTIGHVGDGADGPWGPTPTNDIMAYSTDPPGLSKCVSTLDVEGFALRMSRYLDRNGDGSVTAADHLEPNDVAGDGFNSFQVQHHADHHYASSTGDPRDCPQPDVGLVPGATTDWTPEPVDTTRPNLWVRSLTAADGQLRVDGRAAWLPIATPPTDTTGSTDDPTGDASAPVSDITGLEVEVTAEHVRAVLSVDELWPVDSGGSAVAYSLVVDGRRFDSFVPTTSTDGAPITLDNGTGVPMPADTAVWDKDADTVTFEVPRWYLREQNIVAPYDVGSHTGLHARTNDWLATEDSAPDTGVISLAGPAPAPGPRLDVPKATSVTTRTVSLEHEGGNTFLPTDSTFGLGLISAVETRHFVPIDLDRQATVTVTLAWDDPASVLGLKVEGGSGQVVTEGEQSVTVTVPWARRDLVAIVDPQEILGPVTYTLTAKVRTVLADRDADKVPDVADICPNAAGALTAAGCPDTDRDTVQDRFDRCRLVAGTASDGCWEPSGERIVVRVDGVRAGVQNIMTRRGSYAYDVSAPITPGPHTVEVAWYSDGQLVKRVTRSVG
ncbi:hypothetical protein [Nocardioides antri]|uniref:Uncharacterized protein n=1 Tax=Nocardioides antri TaxID=2607659 RepID=A0A5B1M7G0_9ACTN|nr:hypothetical protein [Nocardioides antri]KAA1428733.1 hypothetical protein F0U47_00470 [Nocardioides antri]